jgi:alkanesulfonate monooxygenase SsuD/methylene tetrahydromethanopterin reductase-like flavin-dependent oxidoreductase (luciferase family)
MEFVATMASHPEGTAAWFAARQREGWHGVAIADHISTGAAGGAYPHVWTTLGHWAALDSSMVLATTFANNLVRSPVEFVHASMTLQAISGGRFEAGLGAGWREQDLLGLPMPNGPSRARRYYEAMAIARQLFDNRQCSFHGEFYDVEMTDQPLFAADPAPPLVAAVGGPWVIDHVSPLADRVELMPMSRAVRPGRLDAGKLSAGGRGELERLATRAREANSAAPLQVGVFLAAGAGPAVDAFANMYAGGPLDGLAGEPRRVADTLLEFGDLGINRVTMVEFTPDSYQQLAPFLIS